MSRSALASLAAVMVAACGGDDGGGSPADAAPADAPVASFDQCSGSCTELTLGAIFGATSRDFDRAFFGLTSPAESGSGDWEIYLESYGGGVEGCPQEDSPTPDFTLIVAGLAVPEAAGTTTDVTVTLIDFEGALLSSVAPAQASASTVTWTAAAPCVACAEGAEPSGDRFVALDLDATFDEGSVAGHVYATHCDSLDAL